MAPSALDLVHGAVASVALLLGVGVGATALFITVVYVGLSGKWPWQI